MRRLSVPLFPSSARWLAVGAVASVIVYYSLVTVPPEPSGDPPLWDKRLHFAAYATLTVVLAYATVQYRRTRPRRRIAVFIVATAFGVAIELAQGLLPYRYFGVGDLAANVLGATLGMAWFLVERRIEYSRLSVLGHNR